VIHASDVRRNLGEPAVYSINIGEHDMKLVFLSKPRLLDTVVDGGHYIDLATMHLTRI
jgi:hypothetical protein